VKRGELGDRAQFFLNRHVSLVGNLISYLLLSSFPLNLLKGRSSCFISSRTTQSQIPILTREASQAGFEPSQVHWTWAGIIFSNYKKNFSQCSWFTSVNIINLPTFQTFFISKINILKNINGNMIFTSFRYVYC
jgi:hypothetical protein